MLAREELVGGSLNVYLRLVYFSGICCMFIKKLRNKKNFRVLVSRIRGEFIKVVGYIKFRVVRVCVCIRMCVCIYEVYFGVYKVGLRR